MAGNRHPGPLHCQAGLSCSPGLSAVTSDCQAVWWTTSSVYYLRRSQETMDAAIPDAQIRHLIPACQRMEADAIEQLYDLYADRIYRYLLARRATPTAPQT